MDRMIERVARAGLSDWPGWDRSRDFWSAAKHQDAVCRAVFGDTWSMEDAATLIEFIERTWGDAALSEPPSSTGGAS